VAPAAQRAVTWSCSVYAAVLAHAVIALNGLFTDPTQPLGLIAPLLTMEAVGRQYFFNANAQRLPQVCALHVTVSIVEIVLAMLQFLHIPPQHYTALIGRFWYRWSIEHYFGATVTDAHNSQPQDPNERRLYPEDQAKVDAFLQRGVNSVERRPFRPLRLIILLIVVVTGFSLLSQGIARWAGVY